MDDLTLLRDFRAERADEDPRARDAAWRALEARLDPAAVTSPGAPARSRRRGILALAGAAALAAAAAIFVLSSGPSAQPAAAEVLRQTAAIAAAEGTAPEPLPGPGQFLYSRAKTVELRGSAPDRRGGSMGGVLKEPGAFNALLPVERESWLSPEGAGRQRETAGTPRFFSSAEQSRWERAGSPLPGPFEPSSQDSSFGTHVHLLEASRGMIDIEIRKPPEGRELGPNFGFPDTSGLPTDPEALRLSIQDHPLPGTGNRPGGRPLETPLSTEETMFGLWGLLEQPVIDPKLRAAVFNALAELPGIELDRDATDLVGRPGYAISFFDQETGMRVEYLFDPDTSEILGARTVLTDPELSSANEGLPAGTVIRESAKLQTGVVDSSRETPDEGERWGPAATTGPVYRSR